MLNIMRERLQQGRHTIAPSRRATRLLHCSIGSGVLPVLDESRCPDGRLQLRCSVSD